MRLRGTKVLAVVALASACMLSACGGAKGAAKASTNPNELPPANPIAVAKMAQGVQASKEPNGHARAVALLREAVTLDAKLWEAHYDLGIVSAQVGELREAETALATAAKLAPAQEDVAVALAEVRRRRGSFKDAADALADFVKQNPEALVARTLYVTSLRDSGQLDKAVAEGREVLSRRPGNAGALSELALCHLAKGERDVAELLVKQAIDTDAKSAVAHRTMGLVQLARGDDAAAFQSFQKAAQLDPMDTTARANMGAVLLKAGVYAKAEEQFRAILAVTKDDAAAEVGLAAAIRGGSDGKPGPKLEEARAMLDRVLAKDPHNTAALFNLGVLLVDFFKKPQDGMKYFEQYLADAADKDPQRPEAQKYIAMIAAGKGAAK